MLDNGVRSVRHHNYHKAYEIAEAVGNHICEVESVPDIVELTDNEAQSEENEKSAAEEFFSELNLA